MSIIRIGLAETKNFSEGWEAIFGKKKKEKKPTASAKPPRAKKKSSKKKS